MKSAKLVSQAHVAIPGMVDGSDEARKASLGVQVARANGAYNRTDQRQTELLQQQLELNYHNPSVDQVARFEPAIREYLRGSNVRVVIPMKENGPVIVPTLEYLTQWVPGEHITVIADDCDFAALDAVKGFHGVRLYCTEEVLGPMLKWDKILPVLGLGQSPKGKGTAILAALLLQYMGAPHAEWMFLHDSETRNADTYRAIECLTTGVLFTDQARYGQIARGGRNNEVTMGARVMMQQLAAPWSGVSDVIRERAGQLFERLITHKWMLTGEFALHRDWMFRVPVLSGYLVETNLATAAEDWIAENRGASFRVEGLDTRLDGVNDYKKEGIMMQQIATFIMAMALAGKSTTQWDSEFVSWFNNESPFRDHLRTVVIPPHAGANEARVVKPEVVWPSVETLVQEGFVDLEVARELAA